MSERFTITVTHEGVETYAEELPLPVEVGRLREEDSRVYLKQNLGAHHRVAISPANILNMPRQALRFEPASTGQVRVINIHNSITFHIDPDHVPLRPGKSKLLTDGAQVVLPAGVRVKVGIVNLDSKIYPSAYDSGDDSYLRTMAVSIKAMGLDESKANINELLRAETGIEHGKLAVSLVNQALEVVRKSAGSDEFFVSAVQSAARMVSLDNAYVILRSGDEWTVRSSFARKQNESWNAEDSDEIRSPPSGSRQLLHRLLRDRQTIVFEPKSYMHSAGSSLMMLDRAVAAPMFDSQENVIGAVYGDRRFASDSPDAPIGDLEAALLEVMAGAVAAGIARQREEAAREREENLRSSMNQFFSPEVLLRLQQDQNLLDGRDAEVTVLFCDIRGFSAISEQVGPKATIDWINDVLTELSHCVLDTDGVLVDYIGDELMAMWGAPDEQPDHAVRACRAAIAMLQRVEPLRERWRHITPDRFGIGIGINTGMAQVGNTGSKLKFKYGPLGNTVNIASRVQGITKQFGVTALIADSTHQAVHRQSETETILRRRIAEVQPVGVQSSLNIYELADSPDPSWQRLRSGYETALDAYHQRDLNQAARLLVELIELYPEDLPSVMLLQRVIDAIAHKGEPIDPVVRLVNK